MNKVWGFLARWWNVLLLVVFLIVFPITQAGGDYTKFFALSLIYGACWVVGKEVGQVIWDAINYKENK